MKLPPSETLQKLYKFFERYMLFIVIIAVGALIIFWPDGKAKETAAGTESPSFSLADMERRLAESLRLIRGAGRVEVILSLKSDMEVVLATDSESRQSHDKNGGEQDANETETREKTVIVGSQADAAPIVTQRIYPRFRGALVICDGGEDASVKLAMVNAVAALTGLGSESITVLAMEQH